MLHLITMDGRQPLSAFLRVAGPILLLQITLLMLPLFVILMVFVAQQVDIQKMSHLILLVEEIAQRFLAERLKIIPGYILLLQGQILLFKLMSWVVMVLLDITQIRLPSILVFKPQF